MLRQKYLKFKGIGRFVEEQTIIFDSLGRLVQLAGQNNNTKGSSGAGKSTVFMAEDYLLGFSNKPGTVLKSRYSEEGIWVEGGFDYDGKELIITRGKKLSIKIGDDVPIKGSSSITEEKLDEILGMPRDLFRKMLHKRQKEGGFFLQMTPADVNDFLSSMLGHKETKANIAIAEKTAKDLSEQILTLSNDLLSAKAALKATQDAISAQGKAPIRDIHQSTVLELKNKYDTSSAALTSLTSALILEEQTLNLSRPIVVSIPFDRTVIETLEKTYKDTEKSIRELKEIESNRIIKAKMTVSQNQMKIDHLKRAVLDGENAQKMAIEIAEQLKKIRQGKCYTCGHDWVDSQTEANLISRIPVLRAQIETGKVAIAQVLETEELLVKNLCETIPKEIDFGDLHNTLQTVGLNLVAERQKEKDHQGAELIKNKALLDTFAKEEASLRARHRIALDQARGQANTDRMVFEAAIGKLKAYEQARTRYEATQVSLKVQEESYSQKVSELTEKSFKIHNDLAMAEELKRGLKSYLSCSFDEALETISKNATTLIRSIPNMANATIQLQGIRETQDGKIKEEVNALLHMDGEENVDIRSLCGGEETALDLAIDLSVIDLLESKANKGIDLFILDEPFNGLDTICIENALEVLKNSNSGKRIIIVDHNPEVKEMVESKLLVIRDGLISRVAQAA